MRQFASACAARPIKRFDYAICGGNFTGEGRSFPMQCIFKFFSFILIVAILAPSSATAGICEDLEKVVAQGRLGFKEWMSAEKDRFGRYKSTFTLNNADNCTIKSQKNDSDLTTSFSCAWFMKSGGGAASSRQMIRDTIKSCPLLTASKSNVVELPQKTETVGDATTVRHAFRVYDPDGQFRISISSSVPDPGQDEEPMVSFSVTTSK